MESNAKFAEPSAAKWRARERQRHTQEDGSTAQARPRIRINILYAAPVPPGVARPGGIYNNLILRVALIAY